MQAAAWPAVEQFGEIGMTFVELDIVGGDFVDKSARELFPHSYIYREPP